MTDSTRTVVLKPGDTLLISGVGQGSQDDIDALIDGLARLRSALGLAEVLVFEGDVNAAAVTPVVPMADAVVLKVFNGEALARHREALAAWLTANGVDPSTVAQAWLSIEQADDQRFIRYLTYRLTQDGRRLIDPRDPAQAWTVERVSPLAIDLDLPAEADEHVA